MADNVASLIINNSPTTTTFPRHARLRNPQQFKQTFLHGHRISAPLFRLHARLLPLAQEEKTARIASVDIESTNENTDHARLGIAVSKRVDAHAVGRNRIKRLVRESFRTMRARLPAGDYVLLAQREAATADNMQLVQALAALWARVIALDNAEGHTTKADAVALKRDPAAITMPPRNMLAADPVHPPESS